MYSSLADFGHHLIVGLHSTELVDDEFEILSELAPTGIILFGKNLDSANPDWISRLSRLLDQVRSAVRRSEMLIAIDHEGGRVHRFPPPVSHFPAALHWGSEASEIGEAIGCELRALGFNLDFAPVLDCFSQPENRVIGDRAFSCDFSGIAPKAIAFARGMERHGVLSCGKHFPGHGGTIADSHHELPHYDGERSKLLAEEVQPFVAYICAGFPLLMSSHVLYTDLDSRQPASMSRLILNDLLRTELGFTGCLVTDDLEMKALDHLTPAEKAVLAINAGTDLLLEANYRPEPSVRRAREMAAGLKAAVESGAVAVDTLLVSRRRVDALLDYADKLRQSAPFPTYQEDLVGSVQHQRLLTAVQQRKA